MKYTIYKITNKIDNKIYIGKHQTNNLDDGYMGSGKILRRAQKKHGLENFVKEILYVFDTEEEMNAKEKQLVTEEFCLREDTYNLCVGGQGGFSYINCNGLNNTESQKAFTREWAKQIAHLGGTASQKTLQKNKIGIYDRTHNGFAGKKHTKQTKLKMRKSKNAGPKNSQYGTIWITNGTENKKIKLVDNIPEGWYKGRRITVL
jgi:hypothetical protein